MNLILAIWVEWSHLLCLWLEQNYGNVNVNFLICIEPQIIIRDPIVNMLRIWFFLEVLDWNMVIFQGKPKVTVIFLPITRICINKLRTEANLSKEYVGETIERKSNDLAKIFCRGNENLERYITYSLRELMRNIEEHSMADYIWYAAQYWETYDLVEIAILDEGIGIRESLTTNPAYTRIIKNDEDALLMAIKPGITKARGKANKEDDWANSGYGLYMTSNLCRNVGDFVLASNERLLIINKDNISKKEICYFGTVVRMRLQISKLKALQSVLNRLLQEGEQQAKENQYAIKTASKASSMLRK